ncbi:MAG: site-2 protease family protein [Chloroflexi bacterium]|nr:site-2 protease family protein [Chloroflexota bacterium]
MAGDIITVVNQADISSMEILASTIQSNLDETIDMRIMRGEEELFISAVPSSSRPIDKGALGIIMGNPTKQLNIAEATFAGGFAVYRSIEIILSLPGQMLSGTARPEEVRIVGYKGMFDMLTNMNQRDAIAPDEFAGVNTLSFFASITVSLGLLNLMPIPALDGGRILFVLPEILFRRRVPPNFENAVHLFGFAFLLLLLVYVNLQDFINPFSMPAP